MYDIAIQRTVERKTIPALSYIRLWVSTALKNEVSHAELTVRIVDVEEMTALNSRYRNKNKPTNVLSFSLDDAPSSGENMPLLGDIVICAEVVNEEARLADKDPMAHWAHIVIHGTLHLLGYDHETEEQAAVMEPQEVKLLAVLGLPNPYE